MNDTIAAISTTLGVGAISIIRVSGKDSIQKVNKLTSIDLTTKESHTVSYGYIKDKDEIIDEVLITIMKGPKTFTTEDTVEINCHGGIATTEKVLELLLKQEIRLAEPGEFTKRAFLNGRIDLSQAEAVMELIDSKNELARRNSVSQLKGTLSEKIKKIREEVLYQIAYIESALDDPEHISLEGYPQQLSGLVDIWIEITQKMLSSYDDGRYISEGIRTCIVGKPNAGKSSFLNTLLGEERAIVTEVAGTTRDTLEESVTIDGITLNMVDTAGIHDTEDQVERIGVEKAKKEIENADIILFLADSSIPLEKEDFDILEAIRGRKKMILLNKSDQDSEFDDTPLREYLNEEDPIISISAKYNEGIDDFIMELKNLMFHGRIDTNNEMYITNARHKKALDDALTSFQCAKTSIEDGMPEDFFTIDLMNGYEKLGLIVGESVEEDLINEIFSRFCTGK